MKGEAVPSGSPPKATSIRNLSILLIIAPVIVGASQFFLRMNFAYSASMAQPAGSILERYHAGGPMLVLAWAAFASGCFLLIPIAISFRKVFSEGEATCLESGTVFGVLTGSCYLLGLMRWVILAPVLSAKYLDPATSSAGKECLGIVFLAFNVYCGNAIGETIAPISHALWIAFLGSAMMRSPLFPRWMAGLQYICAFLIIMRPLEFVGFKTAVLVNALGLILWCVSCVLTGISMLAKKKCRSGRSGE